MSNETLSSSFSLQPKEVVSIVGAGGKTSLLHLLAHHLDGRIVVMPSTKFYIPKQAWPSYINAPIIWSAQNEIVLAAHERLQDKLAGINVFAMTSGYDYMLIEADGSRGLPIKGWGEEEPVIDPLTSTTIGIITIQALGMPLNNQTVFRYPEFSRLTKAGLYLTLENMADLISHPEGLFKDSLGRRILLINQAETPKLVEEATHLLQLISNRTLSYHIDEILIASIRDNRCFLRGYNE